MYAIVFALFFLPQLHAENITVIGIGRVGLCAALCFERAGYDVLGVDINPTHVAAINNKTFTSPEPGVREALLKSCNFRATTSFSQGFNFSDIYYIMVDTPSTLSPEAYDHSKLSKLLSEINKHKVHNKHIIIGCTVWPGYIRDVGNFLLRDCVNTTLSYNPSFIAQGNIMYGFQNPDIVLIGEGLTAAGDTLEAIYRTVCVNNPIISRMSPASAEITKLAVNCFITTKIAYANMIGDIADNTPGADKFEILQAVGADKRVGSACLRPGYGFGGPCFPRDNRALASYAERVGVKPLIPQAADASNRSHTYSTVEQLLLENRDLYVFKHVTYKDDCTVPIIEESQKLVIAAALARRGKKVVIIDVPAVIAEVQHAYGNIFEYETL